VRKKTLEKVPKVQEAGEKKGEGTTYKEKATKCTHAEGKGDSASEGQQSV